MTNPWVARRVLNYAHQGGAREGPSSTLFAMRQALEAGADALELDVHATADGELVVCHDATVDRTTDASGAIADLTLEAVGNLDNAYWFVPGEVVAPGRPDAEYVHRGKAPDDHEFGVATLREVLEAFPGVFLNLDIKQTAPDVKPYEAALAALLREYGRADDVIVASFLDHATDAFSQVAPEISTSFGTMGTAQFWRAVQDGEEPPPSRHHALQVPPSFGDRTVVDQRFVEVAHANDIAVHVWTIDDAAEMERLLALDVDGVMTDKPSVLARVLSKWR
ncbi:MAG TPA: glycerophosphodiester phosphodiesterase [Acidimicrobiales bacterium]|nr:glycerophosphodiester phosphodiesterase [Acidimicrobiales bacterium]